MATVPSYQKQPTLPHLLNEYGFQDAATELFKKKKDEERERRKASRKEKKKKGQSFVEEKDVDKQKEMDEHYIKMVEDMYNLRDYYYNEYTRLLSEKVEKQRKERRQKETKLDLEKQKKETEEKKASHAVKKRLVRHTLSSTPNTISVPKTDLYYIIGLEEKLRREGKLKTPSDYQKFHNEIQQPHVFYSHFKVRKHTDITPYYDGSYDGLSMSYSRGESNDTMYEMEPRPIPFQQPQKSPSPQNLLLEPQQQIRSLSRISESMENSRPTSRVDNWAVTQQFPAQYKSRHSHGSFSQPSKAQKNDQLSDLEKRFPKLEMPKLHCFTLNLAKKPPNPEEVKLKEDLKAREKFRKQAGRTYTKMYQLAMSNAAATARIMDTHDDMDLLLHGPDLCDVISDEHWMRAYGLREADMEPNDDVEGTDAQKEIMPPSSKSSSRKGSAASIKSGSKRGSRRSSAKSQKSEDKADEVEEAISFPLTMDEITGKCNIMESKRMSSLWTNYLRAGKSPWDRLEEDEEDQI